MKIVAALILALLVSSCTTMQTQRYYEALAECQRHFSIIESGGKLMKAPADCSHVRPGSDGSNSGTMVAGALGIAALVTWLIIELADNQNATQIPPPQASPLIQSGGTQTTTFSNHYIQPVFVPVQ